MKPSYSDSRFTMRVFAVAVMATVFLGCGLAPTSGKMKTSSEYAPTQFSTAQKPTIAGLEAKIDTLTKAIEMLNKHAQVIDKDREETLAFNRCNDDCDKRSPWPQAPDSYDDKASSAFYNQSWVEGARKNHQRCRKECEKLRPEISVMGEC